MATTEADARLAALRQDPDVIVRERATHGPIEPAFEVTAPVDLLDLMGREPDGDQPNGATGR